MGDPIVEEYILSRYNNSTNVLICQEGNSPVYRKNSIHGWLREDIALSMWGAGCKGTCTYPLVF